MKNTPKLYLLFWAMVSLYFQLIRIICLLVYTLKTSHTQHFQEFDFLQTLFILVHSMHVKFDKVLYIMMVILKTILPALHSALLLLILI